MSNSDYIPLKVKDLINSAKDREKLMNYEKLVAENLALREGFVKLKQPLLVALAMLKRDDKPVRTEIVEEIKQHLATLKEGVPDDNIKQLLEIVKSLLELEHQCKLLKIRFDNIQCADTNSLFNVALDEMFDVLEFKG